MLFNTRVKQLSKLAVKQTKLELKDFNGKAVKLLSEASTVSHPEHLWFGLIT